MHGKVYVRRKKKARALEAGPDGEQLANQSGWIPGVCFPWIEISFLFGWVLLRDRTKEFEFVSIEAAHVLAYI